MSHFSTLRTQFRDEKMLKKCLKNLGYKVKSGGTIQGHSGKRDVDFRVKSPGGFDIGFVHGSDGAFGVVADWFMAKDVDKRTLESNLRMQFSGLQRQIRREYAVKTVLAETGKKGFQLVSREEDLDGTIRMVVRRWN